MYERISNSHGLSVMRLSCEVRCGRVQYRARSLKVSKELGPRSDLDMSHLNLVLAVPKSGEKGGRGEVM